MRGELMFTQTDIYISDNSGYRRLAAAVAAQAIDDFRTAPTWKSLDALTWLIWGEGVEVLDLLGLTVTPGQTLEAICGRKKKSSRNPYRHNPKHDGARAEQVFNRAGEAPSGGYQRSGGSRKTRKENRE